MSCRKGAKRPVENKAISEALQDSLQRISSLCTGCGICVRPCAFLQRYGTPKDIARGFDPQQQALLDMPFECSLCGLCSALCPEEIRPDEIFIEMRREAVARGNKRFGQYAALLGYEAKGTSKLFSWYGLPKGCETIFFPGCALPGTRPEQTGKVFAALQASEPSLGIVFDCCTKPSHDLGRADFFSAMFQEMKRYLVGKGVKTVLVACPNCLKVFKQYAPELAVKTIYELLPEAVGTLSGTVTIHDPCVCRMEPQAQSAVRSLVSGTGMALEEMPRSGRTTICCGEGGAVGCLQPELALNWGVQRKQEAAGRRTITYCAGCTHLLNAHTPTSHVLDLLFDPAAAMAGKAKVSRPPFTYLNRLLLKRQFRKKLKVAVSRERNFKP
jgi:Fe-S oxidoreductase